MVDLAKIRKKAKGRAATPQPPPVEVEVAPTVAVEIPAAVPAADVPDSPKLDQFKQIAGKRREGFVEQHVETSSADQVELLSFLIAGEQYAVSIDHLVEIVTPREATRVPNADPTIVGIISLRGTIVTI